MKALELFKELEQIPVELLDDNSTEMMINVVHIEDAESKPYELVFANDEQEKEWIQAFGIAWSIMNRRYPEIPVRFSKSVVMMIAYVSDGKLGVINFYALYMTRLAIKKNVSDVDINTMSIHFLPHGFWNSNNPTLHNLWLGQKLSREDQKKMGYLSPDNWVDYMEYWEPLK